MSNPSLEEKNKKIRERMLNLTEIRIGLFPHDSPWLKPVRLNYIQDGKAKTWDLMKAHESVSIIVFNISRKKLIFVRQFRPASYYSCISEKQEVIDLKKYPPTLGLTIELCAGIVDKDKPLVEIAQNELLEECGYKAPILSFQKIITYRFISSSATKQTLFYVEVTDEMNTHPGGGAEEEGELIEIVEMSIDEVKEYVNSEEVQSPPCFLNGIAWFLANKKDRYE
ncbi:uridine diphosphate glucose pyrophosphatase NUDT14-like [Phymastichus coffea]|uniref:uridine diphosphate glucose pyrophosphatase NUDT14-like n=1 Tax=Phymastichus coffea TaxID=108790 RepID=UPI00273AB6EE|nr:uridine diphosphate glucose pyrophosphatase NUDT14-like [Phymastichus coffea]